VADLEADRLRALMRTTVFGLPKQPVTIDRYEIVKLLGSGAMGLVYEVFDPIRGEQVALKTLRGHSPRALALFKREFRALSRITHPNLVGLHELGRDHQQYFFTMELVRGVPLLRYLWGVEPDLGAAGAELPLSPVADFTRLRAVFAQLAEGVHALHRARKLHRDIKPSNVMVTHQGRVVLMDFGFVGEDSVGTLESTAGSIIVGTPAYMAPEQAQGGPRTGAADWYSVGATLYMALTGQVPFHGETLGRMMERKRSEVPPPPRSLAAGIPEDLDALCLRLLQPEPAARISSSLLLAALQQQPHGAEHSMTRGVTYLSPAATHVGARRFIGRSAEVTALRRAHASVCATSKPAVVLVRGRAGLGKSALVRHVTDQLRADQSVVLRARCYERDGVPLKALDSLVDALARHLRQHPRPGLTDIIAALSPLFPVLQAGEGAAQALGEQRPDELDEPALVALAQLLARLAEPRPLVLWLDDLQWGDPGSVRALQRVLAPQPARGPAPAILLIASYRSEDSATSPTLHVLQDMSLAPGVPTQVLELGPLAPDETLALAEAVLGADTARARLHGLAAEAQGSPQFLHDLARFVAHGPDAAPEVTLDELLEIRIARLSEPQRRLLDAVAVAGGPVSARVALRAAEVQQDARSVVQQLLGMGLLRPLSAAEGELLDTYHERTREVVLAHLDGSALRSVHADLAAHLEAVPEPDPELLARLFRGAGDLARARHYAAFAARDAQRRSQFDRAAALFRLAAELSTSEAPGFHIERGDALARAGRSRAAAESYLAARTGADPATNIAMLARAALHLLTSGHLEPGRRVLAEGFALAGLAPATASMRGRLAALWRRGQMAVRGLQWSERAADAQSPAALARVDLLHAAAMAAMATDMAAAADIQAQHLLQALQAGDPRRVGRALVLDAGLAAHIGPSGRGRSDALLAEARALATRLGDLQLGFWIDLFELAVDGLGADFDATLRRVETLARADDGGIALPHLRTMVHFYGVHALVKQGRWLAANERLPVLLGGAIDTDDRCAQVWVRAFQVWMQLARDAPDAARRDLEAAQQAWPHPPAQGYHLQHLQQGIARTAIHLYVGDAAGAWRAAQREAPQFARSGVAQSPPLRILFADLQARSAVAAWRQQPGDLAMRRAAVRAVDDLQGLGARGLASLLRASLNPESAEALLRDAVAEFTARGQGIHHAAALMRLRDPSGAATLRAQGIVDPERLAGVFAP
jgi:hypothetical protein